jgi:hypothetical protein
MAVAEKYVREGHPTIDELIAEQHAQFPRDPRDLLGDFWPEEEAIHGFVTAVPELDFLTALREWRGHRNTDPAA